MPRPLTKKPTNAVYNERVQIVKEMLIEPYSRSEIVRFSSKEWGIGSRAVDDLIARATKEIEEEYAPNRKAEIQKHIARREKLLRRCKKQDDWLYLKTSDSLAKLQGMLNETPQNISNIEITIGGKPLERNQDKHTES